MATDRYKVVNLEEAAKHDGEVAEMLEWKSNWDDNLYLLDTKTGKIVFNDRMEPEDASLDRDLRPLVTLLNALAERT